MNYNYVHPVYVAPFALFYFVYSSYPYLLPIVWNSATLEQRKYEYNSIRPFYGGCN
jgi:hypothetical protein